MIIVREKNYTDIKNQYEFVQKQPFILINDNGGDTLVKDASKQSEFMFDMKNREYFGQIAAIDKYRAYGFMLQPNERKDEAFEKLFEYELSILKKINLSNKAIKDSNYKIEKIVYPLLNKNKLKKEYPSYYESMYKSSYKLKKIKIGYNKKFLPIKIEGYFEDREKPGWHVIRTISYPKITKRKFDKKMKEHIRYIKLIEAENEED